MYYKGILRYSLESLYFDLNINNFSDIILNIIKQKLYSEF